MISKRKSVAFFLYFFQAENQAVNPKNANAIQSHFFAFLQSHNRIIPLRCPSEIEATKQAIQRTAEGYI